VARNAVAVARGLGLEGEQEMTILLGAHLHDLGLMRLSREMRNTTEPLTREELAVVRMHPIWGLELLRTVEFPWDLKPIIRWHHEHCDGSGYPDGLKGDAIPLDAQIVGIADVFVGLTTSHGALPAMSPREALERMRDWRAWWSHRVFDAFVRVVTPR
jgi:HD-GYP domain-containing protein (c-di-GMP phosphodiesterase class II)